MRQTVNRDFNFNELEKFIMDTEGEICDLVLGNLQDATKECNLDRYDIEITFNGRTIVLPPNADNYVVLESICSQLKDLYE